MIISVRFFWFNERWSTIFLSKIINPTKFNNLLAKEACIAINLEPGDYVARVLVKMEVLASVEWVLI